MDNYIYGITPNNVLIKDSRTWKHNQVGFMIFSGFETYVLISSTDIEIQVEGPRLYYGKLLIGNFVGRYYSEMYQPWKIYNTKQVGFTFEFLNSL